MYSTSHLLVGDELCADGVVLGLPEDVVEAEDGALPLLEPHVLLRAAQQDLVRRRRRRDILKWFTEEYILNKVDLRLDA